MGKLQKEREALAEQSSSATHDLPPPEYTATTTTDDTPDSPPPGYTPGPSPYRKVPVGWNLYYKPWSMRTYLVGPHADAPVFALELHAALLSSSRPFLLLFDGPDTKSAPRLAAAHRDGLWKGHAKITVPANPWSQEQTPATEKLTVHTRRMTFSFNVGTSGGKPRREDFEWRYSHGKEVRQLDRWAQGWKLVHLTGSTEDAASSGGSRAQRPHGETSDGRPVVAVFTDNSKLSRTKLARFHFVDAGATDAFGEAWALYVSMSALRIWEMTMNAGAAAGGAAAGGA